MSEIGKKRVGQKSQRRRRTRYRIRRKVRGTTERPRLAVHKSLRYIYAQLIDDSTGSTIAQASSVESGVRSRLEGGAATKQAAKVVGETLAERALEKGLKQVVFDRGGYVYHGKVEALASGAREKGLEF